MGRRKRTSHETADLSQQPDVQQGKARKAPAARRRRPGKAPPAGPGGLGPGSGPGGLGYVLGLHKDEVAEIEWRGEEHPAPAPVSPGRKPRGER